LPRRRYCFTTATQWKPALWRHDVHQTPIADAINPLFDAKIAECDIDLDAMMNARGRKCSAWIRSRANGGEWLLAF
jgi:hypothetical protein